jgi:hypothetical protein
MMLLRGALVSLGAVDRAFALRAMPTLVALFAFNIAHCFVLWQLLIADLAFPNNAWFMSMSFLLNRGSIPVMQAIEHLIAFLAHCYRLYVGEAYAWAPQIRAAERFVRVFFRFFGLALCMSVVVHILQLLFFQQDELISLWLAVVALWSLVENACRNYIDGVAAWLALVRGLIPFVRRYPLATTAQLVEYDDCCAICLCELDVPAETSFLPCRHIFHKQCLQRWMEVRLTCPKCHAALGQRTTAPPAPPGPPAPPAPPVPAVVPLAGDDGGVEGGGVGGRGAAAAAAGLDGGDADAQGTGGANRNRGADHDQANGVQ